jgi:hypothetical protein
MIQSRKKRCASRCICDDCYAYHISNGCDYGQPIAAYKHEEKCMCPVKKVAEEPKKERASVFRFVIQEGMIVNDD